MSNPENDPLSPSSVAAHVLVLIILVIGGCLIEWIKHRWEAPLTTSAMLSIGELAMFFYMIGAVGKAFRWMVEQWTTGKPIAHKRGRELLRQLIPTTIDIRNTFKLGAIARQIIAFIFALIILSFLFEFFPWQIDPRKVANTNTGIGPTASLNWYWRPYPGQLFLTLFNDYSLTVLLVISVLAGLTIVGVFSVFLFGRREARG